MRQAIPILSFLAIAALLAITLTSGSLPIAAVLVAAAMAVVLLTVAWLIKQFLVPPGRVRLVWLVLISSLAGLLNLCFSFALIVPLGLEKVSMHDTHRLEALGEVLFFPMNRIRPFGVEEPSLLWLPINSVVWGMFAASALGLRCLVRRTNRTTNDESRASQRISTIIATGPTAGPKMPRSPDED